MEQGFTSYADKRRAMRGDGGGRGYTGAPPRPAVLDFPGVSERDLLAFIRSAMEWRTLVRMMWTELGKPPVPGFPASRVQQILAGDLPAEGGFFTALLETLTTRTRATAAWPDWLDQAVDPDHARTLFLWHTRHKKHWDTLVAEAEAELSDTVTDSEETLAENLVRRPLSRRAGAVDPGTIETLTEFMAALRALRTRAKLSYRSLEERSKATTAGWLPRATAADMLRRDTLPRAETLWSYTAACGLPKDEQDTWEAARARLSKQQRAERRARELKEVVMDFSAFEELIGDDLGEQAA